MDVVWSVLDSLHFESTTFFCQVILFGVMHYSLSFLVYQPLMKIRDKRDFKISSSLAAAESAAAEARRLKEDYEEKVRSARAEGQMSIAAATEKAEAERVKRLAAAREKASELLAKAHAEAEAARAKAEKTISSQSEDVARAIAARLLVASLGKSESESLVKKVSGKA